MEDMFFVGVGKQEITVFFGAELGIGRGGVHGEEKQSDLDIRYIQLSSGRATL